jgi:hypothetical protein
VSVLILGASLASASRRYNGASLRRDPAPRKLHPTRYVKSTSPLGRTAKRSIIKAMYRARFSIPSRS